MAATKRGGHKPGPQYAEAEPDGGSVVVDRGVYLAYDGAKTQSVLIGGHPVDVSITKREYGKQDSNFFGEPARITFTAADLAGRDAAVGFLQEVADAYEADRSGSTLYVAGKWGDWQRVNGVLPPRPLASVVLAGTQREDLLEDLTRFISDEEVYVSLGIPWHRGYLLHGPTGTGKTSIAKALAGHLGLDLYYMPLHDLQADMDLSRLLAGLAPRSVLLLEDIDVALSAAKTRETSGDNSKVSLSGLLQALDGVMTPHGLIQMMTTNRLEVLDDALIRKGRADKTILIDYLVNEQLLRLLDAIAGDAQVRPSHYPPVDGHEVSPADVVEMAKAHLRDPDAALTAVYTGLLERVPADA